MEQSRLLGAVCLCLATVSINANAFVFNTLNGVDYEWVELTETVGLSRDEVELRLADPNDVLYGYEYASRALVEALLLSYATQNSGSGIHGDNAVIAGGSSYLDDFGGTFNYLNDFKPEFTLQEELGDGVNELVETADIPSVYVNIDSYWGAYAYFGNSDDVDACRASEQRTCYSRVALYQDAADANTALYQSGHLGWDITLGPGTTEADFHSDLELYGSHLVRIAPIPLDTDTDAGGLLDIVEDSNRNGVVDPGETDPSDPDSDDDGALDGQEDINGNGIVDAGEADPLNYDSDGDGLTDGYEINVGGTDPVSTTTVYIDQCDMNLDGEINLGDLLLFQRQILGIQ